jgi:signal transduction histidine kinase
VDHAVEILKDVTEHEHLRAAINQAETFKEADRLKAELLGTVSHELRSPLAVIKGYAATLLRHERRLPRQERHEFLLAIEEASDRLAVIIDRLLEMAQLGTGATTVHRAPVDITRVVREALTALEGALRNRSTHEYQLSMSTTNLAGEPALSVPLVPADPRLLRDVLDNLLENAVKYTPDGGDIAVTVRERAADPVVPPEQSQHAAVRAETPPDAPPHIVAGPALEISVRDTGVGIPTEHLGRVFDRFHRVDSRLTRDVDGLGLGLAICKRIVELHEGIIWAESQPGQGSTFHVVLPLTTNSAPRAQTEDA